MATPLAKRLASDPVSKIELSIRCNSLMNKDITSLSDPCCVVQLMTGSVWTEIGRTETVKNCLNPAFARLFQMDYYFEEAQKIRCLVYDIDNSTATLNDDDFLGSVECTLGEIVSSSPFTRPLMIRGNKVAGKSTITIRAEEIAKSNEVLSLQFTAKNLDKKDLFGKSDPYLEFHRRLKDGGYQLVHRTEVVRNDLNPRWRPFEIRTSRLCGGDVRGSIKVECHDHDDDGSHDFIGSFETTAEEMMQASNKVVQWQCINPKKKAKKKNYTNSGTVVLNTCVATKEYSFLDFIFGGLQINFTVGIDFTASNGNPQTPQSLHYMNSNQPNHYMKAIQSVGQVIQDYDSDQMFPALGYGARIPPTMDVSHCFSLNFNPTNPFCAGIPGILDAYRMCISRVQLYGPTNFSPIIYHVAQFAEAAHREKKAKNYYVLLIITDGIISDMQDTVRAIVYASTLPFSIIVVGVGEADFQAMDILDGDNGVLRDVQGNFAKRDIVQFVPFRNFLNASPAALAKQVLAEIPDQVVSYYRINHIQPEKPKPADAVTNQVMGTNQVPLSSSDTTVSNQHIPSNQPGPIPPGQYPPGQPGQYPPGQPGQHPPGQYPSPQPGQQPPGQYPPGQTGHYPPGQTGHYPLDQQIPSNQPGPIPPGQYPSGQHGQNPPPRPGQHPPGQYPPPQPGQHPPGQYPPSRPGQQPPGQPGQYQPPQTGQHPPGQPGQNPPGQYGQYPPPQSGQHPPGQSGYYPPYPGFPSSSYGGYPPYNQLPVTSGVQTTHNTQPGQANPPQGYYTQPQYTPYPQQGYQPYPGYSPYTQGGPYPGPHPPQSAANQPPVQPKPISK